MIWPSNLLTATNLNVFHANDDSDSGMSRYKFFMIFTAAAFAYYFLPGQYDHRTKVLRTLTTVIQHNRFFVDLTVVLFLGVLDRAKSVTWTSNVPQ